VKRSVHVIAAILGAALAVAPARADTLVDNLDGTTLDAQGNVQHFTGLVIGNDGRIVQVLHRGEKRPRADYAIDEHGKIAELTLLQGLGPTIDDEVIQTVDQWIYTPATKNGVPVPSIQELHFHYERRG